MRICAVASSTPSHCAMVGTLTPSGAARLVLLSSWACRLATSAESLGIGPQPRDHIRVLAQEVACRREKVSEQPCLACPPRSGQHERGKRPNGPDDLCFQLPANVSHL